MTKYGAYKENIETHQEALIFCFLPVLQCEFNIFMKTWNSRMIRQSANTSGGRPDMLSYVPSIAGFTYAGVKVDDEKLLIARDLRELDTVLYMEIEIWMTFSYATVRFLI